MRTSGIGQPLSETSVSPAAIRKSRTTCEEDGAGGDGEVYSLFGAGDSSSKLGLLGPGLLFSGDATTPAEDSTTDGSFNPADDPCVPGDIYSTNSGNLAQLRAFRELANSNCAGPAAGGLFQQPLFSATCGGNGNASTPTLDCQISNQLLEHRLLHQAYLQPAIGTQNVASFTLHHSPAHSGCCDILGITPEHLRQSCAEPSRSPHLLMANNNKHMAMGMPGMGPMHSPQPCMRTWADAVTRTTSSSAPSSPAQAQAAGVCARDLFVVPAGQQPPPPPRAGPPPPPPPPPPRRGFSSGGASSSPGSPQTPGILNLHPFGIAHPPLQDKQALLAAGVFMQPSAFAGNKSCSPARVPPSEAVQLPVKSAPPAGSLPRAISATPLGLQAASSFGRLIMQETACNSEDLLPKDPFALSPIKIGVSAAVLGQRPHSAGGCMATPHVFNPAPGCKAAPAAAAAAAASAHSSGPGTPTAPLIMLGGASRHSITGSRLARSSSGAGSFDMHPVGTVPAPSRLSNPGVVAAPRVPDAGGSSAQPGGPPAPHQLMYMEMHDVECSQYCLGGNLEPHKMWFGVGVHRAIRKLVSNNKKRHALILALHAAGDGNGYGDLGHVYKAVKHMHDSLAAGTGWTSEAGARLFAGVDELRDLLETALREGPGIEPYTPPAYLKPSAR